MTQERRIVRAQGRRSARHRAAVLAQREPKSKVYWLAEAESWSRLSREMIALERTGRDDDPFVRFLALIASQPRL